ncbi:HAMP domain-containing methyl-accepting chemotaxis protein [Rhizobium paknamense]|uniref:Methyl-accepting chemotaxis protein-1 (Serine sensor receptor) n=1 Tax=Rhizobium paknamense TaxID=1206817 RepID=A0ABU0IA01_9HYPH|nr:HAMP domain-containing methyl-accepting chemotaxis protein [Rhizobium paknamense]MDQ0455057.1 methyl-accepting chemotaxis protein-1 (serine sensor receptor) [Rhizobium paknamense]
MKRPTIKVALIALLVVLGTAVGGLSFTALSSISKITGKASEVSDYWIKQLLIARDIKGNFADLRLVYARYTMAMTPQEFADEDAAIVKVNAALDKSVADYESGIRTALGRQLMDKIKPLLADYRAATPPYVQLQRDSKDAEGAAYFKGVLKPKADAVNAAIAELVQAVVTRTEEAADDAEATAGSAMVITSILSTVAMAIVLFGIAFAIRGIATPIRRIASAMNVLAKGDLESAIPYSQRADEIGEMAVAVEVFRKAGLENRRLTAETEGARIEREKMEEAARQRAVEDAEKLRFATDTLGDGLKRLAAGDLSFQISHPFAQEYDSLRIDFNASVQQLGSVISSVLHAVDSMESGTREISSGANDLSRRTEQQAASLEETAAALDEITVNVSNASKRTEEARNVAKLANQEAVKSSEVVSHAEDAMRRIEESSQQISNIIGVIDEIAFQTNLLALNAGVEAARAGEAGKGFAVVAQEVRELAQRSAQAAREIKGLIQNSSSEVDSGVQLVRDTGVALKAIGQHVVQINALMDAIATSAREQSVGLSEVNTAVNQMDQTTQQNAAMVEQSTAASASLASEANKLKELISRFQVPAAGQAAGGYRKAA